MPVTALAMSHEEDCVAARQLGVVRSIKAGACHKPHPAKEQSQCLCHPSIFSVSDDQVLHVLQTLTGQCLDPAAAAPMRVNRRDC